MLTCTKGLDIVEFILMVEDAFGISISDRDAGKWKTLDDLFCYVRERVQPGSSSECATAKVFYRLRRALMTLTGRSRNQICPDMPLEEILPRASRRERWPALQRELGLSLPRLQMPKVVMTVGSFLFFLLLQCAVMGWAVSWYWLLPCPVMAVAIVLLIWLSRPYATILHGCRTLGDLARIVWAGNFRRLNEPGALDDKIWQAIVYLLSSSAGIEPSQITRSLRFLDIPGDL